jgi:LPPG:FO 2-phospho-L-lactate transferase
MEAMGHEVSSLGVASIYKDFLDKFIIDLEDVDSQEKIEKLISKVMITQTIMRNMTDKINLARCILGENV